MKFFCLSIAIITSFMSLSQESYVIYDGGEKQSFKSLALIQEKYEKPYLKTDSGEVIHVEQIEVFQNEEGYFIKNDLTTTKNDFAERVLHGRVSIFQYDLSGNFIQTGQSSERDYYAYQKYDQPLKQMIYQNLEKDLNDNSEAMKKLNKVKSAKKIAPFYFILGGGCFVTSGILFNTTESNLATPFFLSGIACFSVPWILNSKRQRRMDDAIRIYNAD